MKALDEDTRVFSFTFFTGPYVLYCVVYNLRMKKPLSLYLILSLVVLVQDLFIRLLSSWVSNTQKALYVAPMRGV